MCSPALQISTRSIVQRPDQENWAQIHYLGILPKSSMHPTWLLA
uniref:Uncharacterized protein n=1 Tax=Anguilla anguilla TaxID=7936 RepID=A0A0E9SQU2_ANGAN